MLQSRSLRTTGQIATPGREAVGTAVPQERNLSGFERRKLFDCSLDLLRAVGLSPAAVDHYGRLARKTRRLPHELVCTVAEHATEDGTLAAIVMIGGGPA
jgi:hypothetical protein